MAAQTTYEKGIEKGETLILIRQIQKRFGPLSESARRRIESMSSAEHEQLAEAVLTANSLTELGLENTACA